MGRLTKTQSEAKKAIMASADKAHRTLCERFANILRRNLPQMIEAGNGCDFTVVGKINPDGMASLRINYKHDVSDGEGFSLDDGQEELRLPEKKEPEATAVTPEAEKGSFS